MSKINNFNFERGEKFNRTFSDEFKRNKVRELEKNITSVPDICKIYSVSRTSVYRWIHNYSSMANKHVKQVVEAKSDTLRIKQLEDKVKELERIIGQKQLLIDFKEKMIEIAEATYGVDIKKKFYSKPLSGSTSTETYTNKD